MVTGSRDWAERSIIRMALCEFIDVPDVTLVHGGARGADELAAAIAASHGFKVEVHHADWKKHGKAAGPRRNLAMLNSGIDHLIAFHKDNSRGTAHACFEAIRLGIPMTRYVVQDSDYSTLTVERHGRRADR
jgi:hypothetical protein